MQALDAIGNKNAPVGSSEWCVSMHRQAMSHIDDAKTRVSWMRLDLKLIRDKQYFAKLKDKAGNVFADWADYCQYPRPWGLGFSVEVADAIIAEDDGNKLITTIKEEVAAQRMATVEPLAKHGAPSASERMERVDKLDDVKFRGADEMGGGNSADYLAARIKRDRPDIAEAVERGEYRSIRQAAIAAGIVKQNTPLDTLRRAWRKASEEERAQFRDEIDTPIMDRQYA